MALHRLLHALGMRLRAVPFRSLFLGYVLVCVVGWPVLLHFEATRGAAMLLAPQRIYEMAANAALADAIQDKAAEGQTFGSTLRGSFVLPSVNSSTGEITLHGGAVEGVTLPQSSVYPGAISGSMDDAAAAYGDHSALGAVSTTTQTDLNDLSNSTPTANAWRTLRDGALSHSHPDMTSDPIATRTRDVMRGTDGTMSSLFTGCTRERTSTTVTTPKHVPDYRNCNNQNIPSSCTVRRELASVTEVQSCTPGTIIGHSVTNRNASDQMTGGIVCDPLRADGFMNLRLNAFGGAGSCNGPQDILIPITPATMGGPTLLPHWEGNCQSVTTSITHNGCDSFENCQTVVNYQFGAESYTNILNYSRPRLVASVSEAIFEDPPGCLTNALCAPAPDLGWVSSGSMLDVASTNTWQCTDAAMSRAFGPIVVTPGAVGLSALYPGAPSMPPSAVCYQATTRNYSCDFGTTSLPLETCSTLTANPACAFVSSTCLPENRDPVTGHCYFFTDRYDCGYDTDVMTGGTTTSEVVCESPIRCLGNDCITSTTEANPDFGAATAQLTMMQQMQMDNDCTVGECKVFIGKPYKCKTAFFGVQDCCEQPTTVTMADYVQLTYYTYKVLAEQAIVDAAATAATESATAAASGTTAATVSAAVEGWVSSTFGPAAASALSSAATIVASALSVIMWIYMIYQIVMILVSIIWECEESEFELAVKRELKSCVYVGEYCASESGFGGCLEKDSAYCCFNSPLARIIQEQARPQLSKTFGTPEDPDCSGLTVTELNAVDWSLVDLSEWIAILNTSGLMPRDVVDADGMWNRDNASRDPSPVGPQGPTINERVDDTIGSPAATPSADRETDRSDLWGTIP